MHSAIVEILADTSVPKIFYRHRLHLTCRALYERSPLHNLMRLFHSLSPVRCTSTARLRHAYPAIDSWIPYGIVREVCVLGRNGCLDELNDVCVVGPPHKAVGYLLSLLSVDISFESLTVYPGKCFTSAQRRQYIDRGYGLRVSLRGISVIDLRDECT